MKKAATLIVGVLLAYSSFSQNLTRPSIPELLEQLRKTTSKKQQADICFWISWKYCNVLKLDSVRYYRDRLKELAESTDYEHGKGRYFLVNGRHSYLKQDFATCDSNYKLATEVFTKINDTLLLGLVYKYTAMNNIGLYLNTPWLAETKKLLFISIGYLSKLPPGGDLAPSSLTVR